jgi:hypothetical protein
MIRSLLLIASVTLSSGASPPNLVREQRIVQVQGKPETWRLVWRGAPNDHNDCGPTSPETAVTCPCSGVAYAQTGDLVLERRRTGASVERFALTPLFAGSEMPTPLGRVVAVLPRWGIDPRDVDHVPPPAAIRARPAVPILRLRDYGHDGSAGQFLLQVSVAPCGKQADVAVGVTRANPRLHVLTTAEHPTRPLMLYRPQWDALARNPHPGELADWPCGDHGAEQETSVLLRADGGRLHATRITSTCPDEDGVNAGSPAKAQFRKRVVKREVL